MVTLPEASIAKLSLPRAKILLFTCVLYEAICIPLSVEAAATAEIKPIALANLRYVSTLARTNHGIPKLTS
ncbi:MAG: hypothetical protein WCP92_05635 [bacterium]